MGIKNNTGKWINTTQKAVTIDMGNETYVTSKRNVQELLDGERDGVELGKFTDED